MRDDGASNGVEKDVGCPDVSIVSGLVVWKVVRTVVWIVIRMVVQIGYPDVRFCVRTTYPDGCRDCYPNGCPQVVQELSAHARIQSRFSAVCWTADWAVDALDADLLDGIRVPAGDTTLRSSGS